MIAPRGTLVHAIAHHGPSKTLCGHPMKGWPVTASPLDCSGCKLEILKRRWREHA